MERSSKHGARLDDAMSAETEALTRGAPVEPRVEEVFEKEPAGDDQPVPDALIAGDLVPGLRHDELELRSEIAKRLRPSAFPADPATLERVAEEGHAPDHILALLRRLPAGETYRNVQQVWVALGGSPER